jgi:hypothetical protein
LSLFQFHHFEKFAKSHWAVMRSSNSGIWMERGMR